MHDSEGKPPRGTAYEIALAAYRERPKDHAYAQQMTGCSLRHVQRFWTLGSGHQKAIRDVLGYGVEPKPEKKREQELRAVEGAAREEVCQKAAASAKEARVDRQLRGQEQRTVARVRSEAASSVADALDAEDRLCSILRENVSTFISGMTAPLLRAATSLAGKVEESVRDDELSPGQRLHALNIIASVVEKGSKLVRDTVELERLRQDKPTAIVGMVAKAEAVPLDEAREQIEVGLRAIERAKARMGGKVEVLDGGAGGANGTPSNGNGAPKTGAA